MFYKSKGFKYIINLLFGIGAAIVMVGALAKLTHQDLFGIAAGTWLGLGLGIEAVLFLIQGLIPPQPEYHWEKLHPGLDDVSAQLSPMTTGGQSFDPSSGVTAQLDDVLDNANVNRLSIERLGTNLASLSENIEKMNQVSDIGAANTKFVDQANATTNALSEVEGQMQTLKQSVAALSNKYDDMLTAMKN